MQNSFTLARATKLLVSIASLSIAITCGATQVRAAGSAQATTVKIGYFNLALVKAAYPEAKESEELREKADSQLKREVEESNKRLQKARDDKKSPDDLKKLTEQLQIEINAKQRALAELVGSANASTTEKILQAVNTVAKEKGIDLVVDGAGVFAGGQKVLDNGADITEDIVKQLRPAIPSLSQSK
jgi:outer membrane protein